MSIGATIHGIYKRLGSLKVYEMSSRGAFFKMLKSNAGLLITSEYFEGVESGICIDGVRCENIEKLSFTDESFDLCTSTEVFEHVADDRAGFYELWRVQKQGGRTIFTVPLSDSPSTVERAQLIDGKVYHRLPPEYHDDRLRGKAAVLAYRNYGDDIIDRLKDAGFQKAYIDRSHSSQFFGYGRATVVGIK